MTFPVRFSRLAKASIPLDFFLDRFNTDSRPSTTDAKCFRLAGERTGTPKKLGDSLSIFVTLFGRITLVVMHTFNFFRT